MEPFVSADWLAEHRSEVVLVDVRLYLDGRSGREAFEAGHAPGALYVETHGVLAGDAGDGSAGGRHPLPDPEEFASGLAAAGIADTDTVIAYDDEGGVMAARLVWMLRATGHEAAVLDGGIANWSSDELEVGRAPEVPSTFAPVPWPEELLASIDEVARASEDGSAVLIDARAADRFAGAPDAVDPRFGHIPGARSVPTREHLDANGRIASPERLRERFAAAGITGETPVVSYCGSGVTACHNLLALERAGLPAGRLFPGSWSQWSRDPERPVETGS